MLHAYADREMMSGLYHWFDQDRTYRDRSFQQFREHFGDDLDLLYQAAGNKSREEVVNLALRR